jgi:ATP-dependent helicase HrpA
MGSLEREPGTPPNPGAIHRSVLAGFPSQIGRKGEQREYEGPRGLRFVIAPGSSLHRLEPPWIVAAELVETSRLFARAVGRVRSDWVERVAAHLVTREIFEPHWIPQSGQVAAWERVSLHGLVLVPRRRVPFGPIDPSGARDIFIQSALVDEEIQTQGEFLAHNRELIEQLERIEAKKRAQDVLVDLRARFDFYDARVPPDVHSTPSFEKWRKEVERRTPRLLFMSREDLLRPGTRGFEPEDYPDLLVVEEMRLPLDYRHEPGHVDDGVTVSLPLEALGHLPVQMLMQRMEWLVPGMLREKIVAMIRTLPKRTRVRFVPAMEYAEGATEAIRFGVGSLAPRLAEHLHRLTGTPVGPGDFRMEELAQHLRMNIQIVDEAGRIVAKGRDLAALRREVADQIRRELADQGGSATARRADPSVRGGAAANAPDLAEGDRRSGQAAASSDASELLRQHPAAERASVPASAPHADSNRDPAAGPGLPPPPELPDRLRSFPRVRIPEVVSVDRGAISLRAYPALRDQGDAVGMHLLPERRDAERVHGAGVCRLLAIALREDLTPMLAYLPQSDGSIGLDRLALLHAPYGSREVLEQALLLRIAERAAALAGAIPTGIRDEQAFSAMRSAARSRVWDAGSQCAELVGRILLARHTLDRSLDAPLPSTWEEAIADVRGQVEHLMPRDFLATTPWDRLLHLPRYLHAALIRLQKLRAGGHRRDAQLMGELRPFLERLEARWAATRGAGEASAVLRQSLERFRGLLEEFRVSLFAQELRTAVPVSPTRLEREWAGIEGAEA